MNSTNNINPNQNNTSDLPPAPKPLRDQTTPAKLERSVIAANKAKVVDLEKDNHGCLILWRSTNNWWKMCGHSALIYAHHIGPNLLGKSQIHIRLDTDRYSSSPDGVVSVNDIEKFTKELAEHKIKLSSKSTEDIAIFSLSQSFTDKQIEQFRTEEIGNRQRINRILHSSIKHQELDSEIRKTTDITYHVVRKFDEKRFEFIGKSIYEGMIEVYRLKNRLSRDEIDLHTAYDLMLSQINDVMTFVYIAYELNFIAPERIESLARHLHQIHTILGSELSKLDRLESARRQKSSEPKTKPKPKSTDGTTPEGA